MNERRWDILAGVVVFIAALYVFGWGIGSYSLNDPWEPRYPQTVREMLDRGDYITPYYEGEIRWAKPILIYWAMIPAVKIWGNNEFSARLPGVVAGALGVLALYCCLLRLRRRSTALMGAGILATTPLYFFLARYATPDILLTASLAGTMTFFALGRFGASRRRLWFGIAYACVGLGFLAKGPVAGAVTVCAILVFWLIDLDPQRLLSREVFADVRRTVSRYHVLLGAVVFVAVAGPWYLAVWYRHGALFLDAFVRGENLHRFAEPVRGLDSSVGSYVKTIVYGAFPWNSLLPASVFLLSAGRARLDDGMRQIWYGMAWFIAIFLVFSAAGTKLDHYILPITVPLAFLIALVWEAAMQQPTPFWVRAAFLISLGFLVLPLRDFQLLGSGLVMDSFTTLRKIEDARVDSALAVIHGSWAAAIVGTVLWTRHARWMAALAISVALASAVFFSHYMIPQQAPVRTVKHYVRYYQEQRGPDSRLVFYGRRQHTVSYYSGGANGYRYFAPGLAASIAGLAEYYPDLFVITDTLREEELLAELRRVTGTAWHALRSANPRYVLLRPGPSSPPGEGPDFTRYY